MDDKRPTVAKPSVLHMVQIVFQIGQWAVPAEEIDHQGEEKAAKMDEGQLGALEGKNETAYDEQNPEKVQEQGQDGEVAVNDVQPFAGARRRLAVASCVRVFF